MIPLTLSQAELVDLTGYVQPSRQCAWLARTLRITPPRRADGTPVVSRAQVEAALSGKRETTSGPQWSKAA